MQQFERVKSEFFIRMLDGSITVIGRPNGISDPSAIAPHCWAYYGLFSSNGELCAAPSDLSEEVLSRRTKEKLAHAEPTIWFNLLVEAIEVCAVWPATAAAPDTIPPIEQNRRHIDQETEDRLRDVHARLGRLTRIMWPRTASLPSPTKIARELAAHPSVKSLGLGYEALRKILTGRYGPFQSLGLEPIIIGTGTKRPKRRHTSTGRKPT